ncbi:MAG: DUF2339 domain-containing protein [Deltaproteobacteria bacterium]|nr:DUF2339 domain-containing protein [Deltaproteobacteria bacterium]
MQCPVCTTFAPLNAPKCPQCGLELTALWSFDKMKRDWQQAKDEFSARLNRLQDQFDSLETLITSTVVEKARPLPLPIQPQSPPTVEPAEPPSDSSASPAPAEPTQDASQTPPLPFRPAKPLLDSFSSMDWMGEVQFGQKWLLLVGIVITVLGLGFFLKYAFEQNWIGPAGRVALAYLTAAGFLGVGESARRKGIAPFGLYLVGGGIAALYLTTFAASQIYELIGQAPAFGFMILVTLLAGGLSLLYDVMWLSIVGLIGGFLTPVLLSTGQDHQIALMSYMTMLNVGILAIAAFKRWTVLNYLGFGCTWLLFSGWYVDHYADEKFWRTTFFLHLFFLTYAFVPFVYYLVRERQEKMTGFAIMTPNAFIALGFSYLTIREYTSLPFLGIVTLAYAGIFFWMANYVYQQNRENSDPFILLLVQGLLFLLLTVPVLFSGHWITVFWAIQAGVLLWAALQLQHRWLYRSVALLMVLTAGKFVLHDYDEIFTFRLSYLYYARGFTWLLLERWLTSAVVLGVLFRSAQMLTTAPASALQGWTETGANTLWRTFSILLFLILNFEVAGFFYDYARQARFAAVSVLWTLFAAALMALGFRSSQPSLRQCALGLFALTILKVFFWDMANVSTPFRIVSFIVLGLMLIGASYLYYHYRERLISSASDEESTS